MRIFVGNLPYSTTGADLKALFGAAGAVLAAEIVMDQQAGRSRGFGFVEMGEAEARRAITRFDGAELQGRALTVARALPRADRGAG